MRKPIVLGLLATGLVGCLALGGLVEGMVVYLNAEGFIVHPHLYWAYEGIHGQGPMSILRVENPEDRSTGIFCSLGVTANLQETNLTAFCSRPEHEKTDWGFRFRP